MCFLTPNLSLGAQWGRRWAWPTLPMHRSHAGRKARPSRVWSNSGQLRPNLGQHWPSLARFGRIVSQFSRRWSKLAEARPPLPDWSRTGPGPVIGPKSWVVCGRRRIGMCAPRALGRRSPMWVEVLVARDSRNRASARGRGQRIHAILPGHRRSTDLGECGSRVQGAPRRGLVPGLPGPEVLILGRTREG